MTFYLSQDLPWTLFLLYCLVYNDNIIIFFLKIKIIIIIIIIILMMMM